MARILPFLLTLPICGVAFLNSIPREPPAFVRTPVPSGHAHANHHPLRWLPAAGSHLQQFSSPFAPKHTDKSKDYSKEISKDVNGSVNRTQPQHDNNNNNMNVTISNNSTTLANAADKNLTENHGHSESPLFGRHFHYPNLFQNKSANVTSGNTTTASSKNETSISSYYGSLLETYFPFLQQAPSNKTALKLPSSKKYPTKSKSRNDDASVELLNAMTVLQDRKENDTVTVSDLRNILAQAAVSRQSSSSSAPYGSSRTYNSPSKDSGGVKIAPNVVDGSAETSTTSKRPSQVAFPQPSILSYRDVQRGTTFAGGFLGMILGATILPNLWLVGMLLGAVYGYDITKEPVITDPTEMPKEPNMVAKRLISLGRRIAQSFLQAYDHWKTLWFLYKTGQLSYEYYKRYEMLDSRFEIQNKVDAWNRRFAEGKKKFDAWEEENEVSRTILAGLRTVWLVDEQSKRRAREKSRYRLVQVLYDAKFYVKVWLRKLKTWATSFFQEGGLQGVISDLRDDLASGESASARVGAAVVAAMIVNIGGAIFSISPVFSNLLAIVTAVLWPSGALDLLSRIRNPASERLARRRNTNDPINNSMLAPDFMRRYDRNRFHFFERSDGTKRYYRTGQSMATSRRNKKGKSSSARGSSSFNAFWNPRPVDKTKEQKAWWDFRPKPSR